MEFQLSNAINFFNKQILNELVVDCLRLVDPETGKLKKDVQTQEVLWVAGGAVRDYFSVGRPTSDYDIYFINSEVMEKCLDWLIKNKAEYIFENQNTCKLKWKGKYIDIVKRYYPEGPESLFKDIDFTICCAAVTREKVYHHPSFFMDLAKKAIVLANGNNIVYPLSTFWRVQKYIKKGYTICRGGILDISIAINKLDMSKLDNLQEKSPLHLEDKKDTNNIDTTISNVPSSIDEIGLEFYEDGTPKFRGLD